MSIEIHKHAIVDNGANLDDGVCVGAYAIIESGAIIGKDSIVESHSIIKSSARIGTNSRIGHFSVVGGLPQFLGFDVSTKSYASIGNDVCIGEGVTIHRSIYEKGETKVGDLCFLMGNSHVAHDCDVGKSVSLANGALLGGHVKLADHVFVGGGAAFHQFVRVGEGAMVAGLAEITYDVPPFITVASRNLACGINLVGMKRLSVPSDDISEIKKLYHIFLTKSGNLTTRAQELLDSNECPETVRGREFVKFFLSGERGFVRSKSL